MGWFGTALFTSFAVHASTWDGAALDRLARSTTWQRLLHHGEHPPGDINSKAFYLASDGQVNARSELQATLQAFEQPWTGDPSQHARCRFPARLRWLSTQLSLPDFQRVDARCVKLNRWARLDELKSLSLFLVSGYFGNPASTFGHALLKFNTGEPADPGRALDISVNFGAAVPPDESTLAYIFKGLTGGYQAAYSDKEFFTDTAVYSHTEYRDMWDYELALSQDERELLVLHLAELVGHKFDYYFLHRNCAFRLGELLEIATGEKVVGHASAWYMPAELFHSLHRPRSSGASWVQASPRFVPSSERRLLHTLKQLQAHERDAFTHWVDRDMTALQDVIRAVDANRRSSFLEALLAYQAYRVEAAQPAPPQRLIDIRDDILRARLALPPGGAEPDPVPPLPSPAARQRPMMAMVGTAKHADGPHSTRMAWAPIHYGEAAFHGLQDQSLVVAEINLDLQTNGRLRLGDVDLLRLRKLSPAGSLIPGAGSASWHLQLGLESQAPDQRPKPVGRGGIGQVWQSGPILAGLWLHAVAGGQEGTPRLAPGWSLDTHSGSFKTSVQAHYISNGPEPGWRGRASARYAIDQDWSVALDWWAWPRHHMVLGLQRFM